MLSMKITLHFYEEVDGVLEMSFFVERYYLLEGYIFLQLSEDKTVAYATDLIKKIEIEG